MGLGPVHLWHLQREDGNSNNGSIGTPALQSCTCTEKANLLLLQLQATQER
jgi:hypothetical protein